MRYFIDISYDGSNYHGWQIQPNADTVQHQINLAFSTILNEEINVIGAGDKRIHACIVQRHLSILDDLMGVWLP